MEIIKKPFLQSHAHSYVLHNTMKTTIVIAMASTEIAVPTMPITSRDKTTGSVKLRGAALSKMAKCVR